jgi:D-amino-acid dehydrogenase
MFTEAIARLATAAGVTFHYSTTIDGIEAAGGIVTGVATSRGVLSADTYVAAMGSFTPMMVAPLGIRLPVYPIKGYSLTVPITDTSTAPVSTVMDETYKVATTRFETRIRVGGTAEIAGWDTTLRPHRRGPLERSLRDLFPTAGDLSNATFWCGLRPMTPDGTPVLGPTKYANLFLNTGHGTLGWTMAAGSGRVLADLISGKPAEIDTSDLGLNRYAA